MGLCDRSIAERLLLAARGPLERLQIRGARYLVDRFLQRAQGEIAVRLSTGIRMRIDLSDRLERLYAFRAYERGELRLIKKLLSPGAVMLDVGAHVGYYALHATALVGPEGQVHAFEPVPHNAARFRMNADLNGFGNLTIVEAAVAAHTGRQTFQTVRHAGETGWGSLLLDPGPNTQRSRWTSSRWMITLRAQTCVGST